uniref:Uncharacterized protein n=1 Tax=Rhizophora mucronata TaxID=61149 RepID=A0A2P2N3B1_RHIMU
MSLLRIFKCTFISIFPCLSTTSITGWQFNFVNLKLKVISVSVLFICIDRMLSSTALPYDCQS